jgi:hypothetical protein
VYDSAVDYPFVAQSEPLSAFSEDQDAKIEHVLDALRLGQKKLAEDIFSRVAKQTVFSEIEKKRNKSPVAYPEIRRILSEDLDKNTVSIIEVAEHRLICHLDADRVVGSLEIAARHIGDVISSAFAGAKQALLIDSLTTSIEEIDSGLWSFKCKQKYAR